ncbi:MAG TPA: CdaR family protein [Dehalococcoidia bacterium]|nr:CdaR family protein [Dehalococcoidia bacterium]
MSEFARRLPRALLFLARAAVSSVLGNVSLAVLSAALGLSLWVFVTNRENPRQVQTFNSAIVVKFINVPKDLAIANVGSNTVRIRVEATSSELSRLRASDFQATVNLGGFQRGTVAAAVEVAPPNGGVIVVDTAPATIDVTLDDLRTKQVPVNINLVGSPQQGYQAIESSESASPSTVTVSGAASLVASVEAAWADVNLTGRRVNLDHERIDLTPRDNSRRDVGLVTVDPSAAAISVQVQQQAFTKTIIVNPVISGSPAVGYNIAGVSASPALVQVTGPADVLASIDAVQGLATAVVAIDDSRADVVRTVAVIVPAGVQIQGPSTVRVTVTIQPARGEATFQVVPQIRNVGGGLALTIAGPITVTLAGDIPTLNALTPEAIAAVADAQGLGAGLHLLTVQVTAPSGTTVVRVEPPQVGIGLTGRPQ